MNLSISIACDGDYALISDASTLYYERWHSIKRAFLTCSKMNISFYDRISISSIFKVGCVRIIGWKEAFGEDNNK